MPDAMLAYLLKSGESTVMADGDVLWVQLPSSIEIGGCWVQTELRIRVSTDAMVSNALSTRRPVKK